MSDLDQSFAVGDDPRLELKLSSGSVRLLAGAAGSVELSIEGSGRSLEKLTVEQRGDTIIVHQRQRRFGSAELTAVVPAGTSLQAELASADLTAEVELASLTVALGSGDISVANVAQGASVATASGDVRVGIVGGNSTIATASGDIRIVECTGEIECKTLSGDITIGRGGSAVEAKTTSGDLKIGAFGGSALTFKTMSGDARVGLEPGLVLDVDIETLSGDVRNEFGLSTGSKGKAKRAELSIKTLSGDVTLFSA